MQLVYLLITATLYEIESKCELWQSVRGAYSAMNILYQISRRNEVATFLLLSHSLCLSRFSFHSGAVYRSS